MLSWALLLALLLPAAQSAEGVAPRVLEGSPGRPRLELRFPAAGRPRATLLLVHGGSWTGGAPADLGELAGAMAARGYASVCSAYRLARPGQPSWPQALLDLKAAASWIRGPGRAEGLAGPLVVCGVSAGAQLALLLGTSSSPGAPDRPDLVVSVAGVSDFERHVQAQRDAFPIAPGAPGSPAALFVGGPWGPATADTYREASPVRWVTPDDPPCLLLHGLEDSIIEFAQALHMDAALDAAGVASLVVPAPGGHGLQAYGQQAGLARLLGRILPPLLAEPGQALLGEDARPRPVLLSRPGASGGWLLELHEAPGHALAWLGLAVTPPGAAPGWQPCLTDGRGSWTGAAPRLPCAAAGLRLRAVTRPAPPALACASAVLQPASP